METGQTDASTHDLVTDYYGRQLQGSADLKTSACCDVSSLPAWLKPLLARIHPEVLQRYYGCGLVCPPLLQGCRVLDLGCGSGRDVYALAQLVGATGEVVGVDMTDEQLAVARAHQTHHAALFGYGNVQFLHGYIERLEDLGLALASFDVIVSNCVVNLSPDKDAVLAGVQRLLKPGGEFLFLRHLRRPPRARGREKRPGALRGVPGRRALLERFSSPRQTPRLCRLAAGGGSPTGDHRPATDRAHRRPALFLRHLPFVQA